MKHINDVLIHRKDPNDHIISIDTVEKEVPENVWESVKNARAEIIKNREESKKRMNEMFRNDITFCSNNECHYESCMRHHTKIPVGVPVSIAMFRLSALGRCDYRVDDEVEDA